MSIVDSAYEKLTEFSPPEKYVMANKFATATFTKNPKEVIRSLTKEKGISFDDKKALISVILFSCLCNFVIFNF